MFSTELNIFPSFQTYFTTRCLGQKSYHLQLLPPTFNHQLSKFLSYLCTSLSPILMMETVSSPFSQSPVLSLYDPFATVKQNIVFLKCKSYYSPAQNSSRCLSCLLNVMDPIIPSIVSQLLTSHLNHLTMLHIRYVPAIADCSFHLIFHALPSLWILHMSLSQNTLQHFSPLLSLIIPLNLPQFHLSHWPRPLFRWQVNQRPRFLICNVH